MRKDFICSAPIFNFSVLIPHPVVANQKAKFDCRGQYLMSGPLNHFFDSLEVV